MNLKTFLKYSFLFYILFMIACTVPEEPVTKQEAAALAVSLAEGISNHNASRFDDLLDMEAFEKRVIAESPKLNRTMLKGAMNGLKSSTMGKQIIKFVGEKGTYELVKQYEKDNHQHLVFRLYNEEINYHDYELVKKKDQVKIADIFVYITGEKLSTTLAQSLEAMDAQASTLTNKVDKELDKLQRIRVDIRNGSFTKADHLYKTLPATIRAQKMYKILYIQIAKGLGNDEYLAALEKFKYEYPDAPNMYLLMVDAYVLRKDYAGALKCVNSLDSLINKDPFLDYYRSLMYKLLDDHANEMSCLERLHQNMPAFAAGQLQLINAYVEDKQLDKAATLTLQYKKNKDADTTSLRYLYLLHPDFKKKIETAGN